MGWGLGKNSPVVLSLGKANYEALINRHGQWVRWRMARKCPCITAEQPNVHCEKCGGNGDIYEYQKHYYETLRLTVRDAIMELPEEYADSAVLQIYDAQGTGFQFVQAGSFIEITGGGTPKQNEVLELRIRKSLVTHSDGIKLEKIGNNWYRVPGVESPPSKIEGVYYKAPGDVIHIDRVENGAGEPVAIKDIRQNMIRLAGTAEIAYGVDYILPYRFLILSQDLNNADEQMIATHIGDAMCTYPYMFDVAENDCITVLSGTITTKALITKCGNADDVLPEFFVANINRLETSETVYQEGIDFVLTGTNYIHWLGEHKPEEGAYMSIVYQYYPTYRVAKNVPMLRTGEDQRLPRKAVVKLYSAFGESKRVHHNEWSSST